MSRQFRKVLAFTLAGAVSAAACATKKEAEPAKAEAVRAERGSAPLSEPGEAPAPPPAADPAPAMNAPTTPPTSAPTAGTDTAAVARSSGVLGVAEGDQGQFAMTTPVGGATGVGGAAGAGTVATGRYGTVGHGAGTGASYGKMGAKQAPRRDGLGGYSGPPAPAKRPAPKPMESKPVDEMGTEDYKHYEVNKMTSTAEDRLSTFAADVDTASYAIARRKILAGETVPADAVRVEEFLNYFKYAYEGPTDKDRRPFAVHIEAAPSPFTKGRHLLRVGVQGKKVGKSQRKTSHLTFLVDVSGSMSSADKLPLAKRALRILVDNLNENDTVALVTYAGSTRVVLPPTTMNRKADIHAAIENLQSGGSTAMASGIDLAYEQAVKTLSDDSESRVIILSDGDTNVGTRSWEEILKTVHGRVKEGVTLSTIGFGMGNYKDTLMEQLANKGNGNYYYIDSLSEAKKVFQEQLGGTLEVIAQDVKLQVDFDPKAVARYRLVGYENRDIADADFRNDKVDAGEIGAGHAVTALYEIELAPDWAGTSLATVQIRAKKPGGSEAAEWAYKMDSSMVRSSFDGATDDFRFAVAVMGAAEVMRGSPYAKDWSISKIAEIARAAATKDNAERQEFLSLLQQPIKVASR